MKMLTVSAITSILATLLVFSTITSAYAATIEDGRHQLSPKSFGHKTKMQYGDEVFKSVDSSHKGMFDTVKKELLKTIKKTTELEKALQFMKIYYRF